MRTKKIKYIVLFIIIILFVIYQILLSFNIVPYILTSEDIIVILFLLISLFLLLISLSTPAFTGKIPYGTEGYVLEAGPEQVDISPITDKDVNFFMKIQEYFKGSINESEILSKLLAAAAKITKSKRASILLYNGKMDELYIFKTMGWSKDEIKMLRGTKIQPGEGITGRVFLDGKPLIVNNIEKKTDFEPKDKYRSKSFVSVPILTDEAIIGVINLTEKESEIYSDKEMNILYFMINEISGRVKLPIGR